MAEQKLISATQMGRAVHFDPQFTMPQRPHFPEELVVIPLEDGILIEGTADQQVLRGKATRTLIPHLLPLLDGKHTLDDLVKTLPGFSAQSILNTVALLYTRGLLEDCSADPVSTNPAQYDTQTLAFFRRFVDTTRVNRSALQALVRLSNTQVSIVVSGMYAQEASPQIQAHLIRAGVGHVHELSWDTDLGELLKEPVERHLIIVLVEGKENQEHLSALDEQCARYGIPWLRVSVDIATQIAELGPYFERGETACYRCFARATAPSSPEAQYTKQQDRLITLFWAHMLVIETVYLLSRIAPLATGVHVTQYHLQDWSSERIDYPKLPGCPTCRPAAIDKGFIEPAVVYEDTVAFPSRHLLDPKDHQIHYRASNVELAHSGKRYLSNSQIVLPRREDIASTDGTTLEHLPGTNRSMKSSTRTLDITALASILLKSAGIRETEEVKTNKLQRWTPTGGNLGSVELYVAVRAIQGLTPGWYFYQAHDHTLVYLSGLEQQEFTTLCQEAMIVSDDSQPDAFVICVGAYHRVGHKYASFGYRIINLDAGVALAQMHLVASSVGINACNVQRWADDIIADRLNLTDVNEMVTGVLALRGRTTVTEKEKETAR